MSDHDFDLFIIGGGSGGVRAGRIAAGHGARVGIAEEYRFGGTCVIRGCIPKKLFVYASRFRDEFEDAEGFGWTTRGTRFDWPTLLANKDREIKRLEDIYRRNVQSAGAKVFDTRATLADANTVVLASDGRRVTAKTILIATGGHPVKPDLPGAEHAITSNEAFELKELPASILIVGGGYIAVEFAGIFDGLGVETTLVYRGEKILRGFDEDMRDGLMAEMFKREIDLRVNADIASIEKNWSDYTVTLKDGSTLEVECVMFATGRSPNTAGLGLDKAGVKLGEDGEILVDEDSRSSVANIYAVGDVTDRVNLTPVAIREGHAFADTVFGKKRWTMNHELIPTAVFSTPEIGTVGLPEHIACQRYPQARHLPRALPPPQAHAVRTRRVRRHEAAGRRRHRQGRRLPHAGAGRGRDRADGGDRAEDGGHQGRFRRHRGPAPEHRGRVRDHAREACRATPAAAENAAEEKEGLR